MLVHPPLNRRPVLNFEISLELSPFWRINPIDFARNVFMLAPK
jgi:hypothetical protein